MKIYITGHTGYIGSKLVKLLANVDGCSVKTIGRSESSDIQWNLDDSDQKFLLEEGSTVIHLAGVSDENKFTPDEMDVLNRQATQSLAKISERSNISHFIFLSTCAVYSPSEDTIDESTKVCPLSPYGQTKLLAEKELRNVYKKGKFTLSILRPSSVYGLETNPAQSTVAMLNESLKNKKFIFLGDGSNNKSFVHINDVIGAIERIVSTLTHPDEKEIRTFVLSSEVLSTKTLIATLCRNEKHKMPLKISVSPIIWATNILLHIPIINGKAKIIEKSIGKWQSNFEIDGSLVSRSTDFIYTCNMTKD